MNGPDGRKFVWGRIQSVDYLGNYAIVTYVSDQDSKVYYHPYVLLKKWEDTNRYADTMDKAILEALAYYHDGCNSHFAFYAARMLRIL